MPISNWSRVSLVMSEFRLVMWAVTRVLTFSFIYCSEAYVTF